LPSIHSFGFFYQTSQLNLFQCFDAETAIMMMVKEDHDWMSTKLVTNPNGHQPEALLTRSFFSFFPILNAVHDVMTFSIMSSKKTSASKDMIVIPRRHPWKK